MAFAGEAEGHEVPLVTGSRDMSAAAEQAPSGLARYVSLFGSIRPYERAWLSRDVIAGVTLAALAIPEVTAGLAVHVLSGRSRADGASYLGTSRVFDQSLAFAERYADPHERDYDALQQAVASGRVAAQRGL